MEEWVFDIEANGFNPTHIHCLGAAQSSKNEPKTTTKYENIAKFVSNKGSAIIAHNCIRYDIPVIERLVGVKVGATVVDTLMLSWYLYPKRKIHGLEAWGEYFGVPKPEVTDWDYQPIEVYLHRVKEDVKINTLLWEKMKRDLMMIYGDMNEVWRFIRYLTHKMGVAQKQEELKWKLDEGLAQSTLDKLLVIRDDAYEKLILAMPKKCITQVKKRPAKPYKQSGDLSVAGDNWFNLLIKEGLPADTQEFTLTIGYEDGKPSSHPQKKAWLYSLGWVPETFEFKRNKETGEVRQIPQIGIKDSGGDICNSVKKLFKIEPSLSILEGLSIVEHRVGVFVGFLRDVDEDGYIQARVGGLTNTLRWKHRELVNLPAPDKLYGKEVRACLTAPEGYTLCGSDQAALEDRTKQHYMFPYDPDYVRDMMTEGYCPHVDIAVLAKYLAKEQEDRHKTGDFLSPEDKKEIKSGRKAAKPVNYGGVYGIGAEGLHRDTGMSIKQAKALLKIYWERNWSVKIIAEDTIVKTLGTQMWLYNPVSRFWYSLRYEKDRFSTLNQGTGVYCFDMWVMHMVKRGLQPIGQFHDEVILLVKLGDEKRVEALLQESVKAANKTLKLNRDLDVDVQFGNRYSEIH